MPKTLPGTTLDGFNHVGCDKRGSIFPTDGCRRAGIDGLLNQVCGTAFGFNDLGFLLGFIQDENFWADFSAGATKDAGIFVYNNPAGHGILPIAKKIYL
jgi:hypothetical protein